MGSSGAMPPAVRCTVIRKDGTLAGDFNATPGALPRVGDFLVLTNTPGSHLVADEAPRLKVTAVRWMAEQMNSGARLCDMVLICEEKSAKAEREA